MSSRRLVFALALGALITAPANSAIGAQAVDQVARDCSSTEVAKLGADALAGGWALHHPDTAYARLSDPLRRNAWRSVLDSVTRRFNEMVSLAGTELPLTLRDRAAQELDSLAPIFARVEATPTLREQGTTQVSRWELQGDPDRPRYELFIPASATGAPQPSIQIDSTIPRVARRAVCWTALTVRRVLTFMNEPGRLVVVARLEELNQLWTNYAEHGHSQLPWELFLNGKVGLKRGVLEPPRYQIIALHAVPALEISGKYPDWHRDEAAVLEIAGFVRYNDDRTSYWALSGFASMTPDRPLGWGPMLHVGRAVKLGYAFRGKDDDGRRERGLVLSADLFAFILEVPKLVRERKLEALQEKFVTLTSNK